VLLLRFRLLRISVGENALVNDGAVQRVTDKPARHAITEAGGKRLNEYWSRSH